MSPHGGRRTTPPLIRSDSRDTEMPDISELFAEQQTNFIEWNGLRLFGLLQFDVMPSRLQINFISSISVPVQGLQIRMRGGTVLVNGIESDGVVLWRDSAPGSVEVEVRPRSESKSSLKIWNVWRGCLDVTQAWLGNAAMQIEGDTKSGRILLRCSDGHGEPNFDDLVAEVLVR